VASLSDLGQLSLDFASRIQGLLRAVLPGNIAIESTEAGTYFSVHPVGAVASQRAVPLLIDGAQLARLSLIFRQELDHTGRFLKTSEAAFTVYSDLDRQPLFALDYKASMNQAPVSHWNLFSERGALTHLLSRAHALGRVKHPHRLSSLHFPTGGERFRPSLEDLLQFLIHECGFDAQDGWKEALATSREQWRRLQLRTAVRDLQDDAARVLQENGWSVSPPEEQPAIWSKPYRTW